MTDNCDMNLFDPENMEIKPGKVSSFIPEYSKLIVSARSDSTYCIEFEIAERAYEFDMSKEQAVKLARGIFTLSGEEIKQGEWLPLKLHMEDNYHSRTAFRCDQCRYVEGYRAKYCAGCGARMGGG